MGERALRGSRLGAVSYENDHGGDFAPRRAVKYDCPNGHHFGVPFSSEAEVPATWECRSCGATATIAEGARPEPKKARPARTHWDMLLERRSVAELEDVLAERLALLRGEGRKSA
jgi:rubredoxin